MNNNISRDVYERYIDAATALFMEYYSCDMGENIRKEIEAEDTEAFTLPKELDDRCRELIKKECATRHRNNYWKSVVKGLRYVAAFAVILLAAASVLFVSVEAIRIPIISYYVENSEGYWELSSSDKDTAKDNELLFDVSDPLFGLLPDEYELMVLDGETLDSLVAIYQNDNGEQVFFSAANSNNSNIQIDSEGAQISQTYQILGKDIILVKEDSETRLAWIDEELSTSFVLIATNMQTESLLTITEHLIKTISR